MALCFASPEKATRASPRHNGLTIQADLNRRRVGGNVDQKEGERQFRSTSSVAFWNSSQHTSVENSKNETT
jgi:hypothetical protein